MIKAIGYATCAALAVVGASVAFATAFGAHPLFYVAWAIGCVIGGGCEH